MIDFTCSVGIFTRMALPLASFRTPERSPKRGQKPQSRLQSECSSICSFFQKPIARCRMRRPM